MFRSNFYQEVNLLHKSNHENIVKLLAVCFAARQPLLLQLLVTEYLEWVSMVFVASTAFDEDNVV